MRILYLSPLHPLLPFGAEPLSRWQTQMSHVRALRELRHSVKIVVYSPNHLGSPSLEERIHGNIRVLTTSGKFDAIILSLGADVLLPLTVRILLARFSSPLIILSGVSPLREGNPREQALAPLTALVVTNDQSHADEWLALGTPRVIVLPISAIDPMIHFPRPVKRDLDVVFAGTVNPERTAFLKKLRTLLPPSVSLTVKQFIWEEEYATILSRAKIALNPLRSSMKQGANLRLFEIPAFGALELASHSNSSWLTPGKEVISYQSARDAAAKILYFLKHSKEREKIARAGRTRVFREHTFVHRFKKILLELGS